MTTHEHLTSVNAVITATFMFEIFMALGRLARRLLPPIHSTIQIHSLHFHCDSAQCQRGERGGETQSCRFPKCDKSNFSHGKHNALPLFETDERRGGDEFIQSSGDSFTLASPRWRPSLSLSRQSAGRHNNVKLGALFPRKYPTDGWTNRQPFYVNEKTENDATAVASPRLPASLPPLIIPTFSLL